MNILFEGIRSSVIPCSLAVLIPGVALAIGSGKRIVWSVPGFALGVWIFAWVRFAGWVSIEAPQILVAVMMLGGLWLVAGRWGGQAAVPLVAGGLVGVAAAWLWRPCVGPELGTILNEAPRSPLSQLFPVAILVLGLCLPLFMLIALRNTWQPAADFLDRATVRRIGVASTSLLAVFVAIGLYEDFVWELYRRSSF